MAAGGMNLEQQFGNFSKFEDIRADGQSITLTNIDKWLKQAKVLDGKVVTNTHTGVSFNKWKSRTITFLQFVQFLDDLCNVTNMDVDELKTKLMECGLPGADAAKEKEKGKK